MNVLRPSMLELMDNTSIVAVEDWRPMGLDKSAGALLIAQFDSPAAGDDARRLGDICEAGGAGEVYVSEDPAESEMLVGARRMVIPALESAGDWLLDDVAVPRTRLADTMVRIQDVAQRNDVQIATFGHAGDGNLHPTIVTPRGDQNAAARAQVAFDEILDVALSNDGTVTGEHGIGLLKREALAKELDDVQIDLHTRIKEAFDPRGILNPGKALPRW
jgi:glycolate oxidase